MISKPLPTLLDEIAARFGGRRHLKRLDSVHASGEATILLKDLHLCGRWECWYTAEGQFRETLNIVGQEQLVTVFDGVSQSGWMVTPDDHVVQIPEDMRADLLRATYLLSLSWLFPDRIPGTLQYCGRGESTSHYKLRATFDGQPGLEISLRKSNRLPDRMTWLPQSAALSGVKQVAAVRLYGHLRNRLPVAPQGQKPLGATTLLKWRKIRGIRFPNRIEHRLGRSQKQIYKVENIELNPELSPGLFKKPKQPKPNARFGRGLNAVHVPFRLIEKKIIVDLQVNGHGPLSFIFDTGSAASIIDESLAKKLHLHIQCRGRGKVGAGNRESVLSLAKGVHFELEGLKVTSDNILVSQILRLADVDAGLRVDGLLGGTFIRNFTVDIDYGSRILTLFKRGSYQWRGHAVQLDASDGTPRVTVTGRTPGRRLTADVLMDTGSTWDLIFTKPFADDNDLLNEITPSIETVVFGIAGKSSVRVGRLLNAALGRRPIHSPVVGFSQVTEGSLGTDQFDGILGGEILSRFRVRFDYARGQMVLNSTPRLNADHHHDMSGLVAVEKAPDFLNFEVVFVISDSPASEAGLRPGDIIHSVDDCEAEDWTLPEFRHICRIEGRKCVLGIRRGETKFERTIVMRPVI